MPSSEERVASINPQAVLVGMRAAMPWLRPSEQRIAALFLADASGVAELSIAQIAARCNTSTASVVRFSKSMGYERLKELRMDVLREDAREKFERASLSEVSGDIDRGDTIEDIIAKVSTAESLSLSDTAKILDPFSLSKAVAAVAAARRIDIFGVGASAFVGLDLQQKLIRIGHTALNWTDTHGAWTSAATLNTGCVAIAVSHSGATADTIDFLSVARQGNATTIAITNHGNSELANYADIVLTTAARETGFRSGALGSRIAQLMVVDCLFIGIAQSNYDYSMESLRKTYAAVHRGATR